MEKFSFKELYNCYLKAINPMQIGDRIIQPNEIITSFDNIQIAGLDEMSKVVTANGGFDNRPHVFWKVAQQTNLVFNQGVFSKEQFSLLTNTRMAKFGEEEPISITCSEELESNEECAVILKNPPSRNIFVYKKETGERITDFELEDSTIIISEPYVDLIVTYEYDYRNNGFIYRIGQSAINGYIALEGKTRTKDDESGQVTTGLIRIPRLTITSDFSIRLGRQANPVVGTFTGTAIPVGRRGDAYTAEFIVLDNDIDSDF